MPSKNNERHKNKLTAVNQQAPSSGCMARGPCAPSAPKFWESKQCKGSVGCDLRCEKWVQAGHLRVVWFFVRLCKCTENDPGPISAFCCSVLGTRAALLVWFPSIYVYWLLLDNRAGYGSTNLAVDTHSKSTLYCCLGFCVTFKRLPRSPVAGLATGLHCLGALSTLTGHMKQPYPPGTHLEAAVRPPSGPLTPVICPLLHLCAFVGAFWAR